MEEKLNMGEILIITGGTSGHILPAIKIFNELSIKKSVILMLNKSAIEKFAIFFNYHKNNGKIILMEDVHYNWKLPYKILVNIITYFKYVYNCKYILSFSSLYTVSMLILATILRRKIFLQEIDVILNKTNKLFLYFSYKIFTGFSYTIGIPQKYHHKIHNIGVPVTKLSLMNCKNVIFIMGATNGWNIFDKTIIHILSGISLKDYVIYHNCRKENVEYLVNFYKNCSITAHVSEYFENYEYILQISKFIITRAGAYSLAYICALKKNAIIIPWSHSAHDHQRLNAERISSVNGGILIEEENIHQLSSNIEYLLNHKVPNRGSNISRVLKVISPYDYVYEFLKFIDHK